MAQKNTIKLTENDLKLIISESVKRILNEASWGLANDAVKKSENRFYMIENAWDKFAESADELIHALNGIDDRWGDDDLQPENTQGPILGKKLEMIKNEIEAYVDRKRGQKDNLQNHENEKFNKAFGGRTADQVANDIDKKWNDHFEAPNYTPWEQYKKQHLTPDEQDFNDRNP